MPLVQEALRDTAGLRGYPVDAFGAKQIEYDHE